MAETTLQLFSGVVFQRQPNRSTARKKDNHQPDGSDRTGNMANIHIIFNVNVTGYKLLKKKTNVKKLVMSYQCYCNYMK